MSSLYDKYHSDHNRNYMYSLIKNIIFKEHKLDVSLNETYNHFFQTNFINTFKTVDTEDIKDLNNHLLNTQLDYFQDFILKESTLTSDTTETSETADFTIHSFQRNINLQNSSRHNFRIQNPCKQKLFQVEKVILPIEDTPLFLNPILTLSLDTTYLELHLRGTIQLRDRDYGVYTPFYEKPLLLTSDVCRIQFKNQLLTTKKGCDVFKIIETNKKKISLSCPSEEFKEGDYIRICNFKTIDLEDETPLQQQYKVIAISNNEDTIELKVNEELSDCKDLYVMNMSLQNTIHCSSPV